MKIVVLGGTGHIGKKLVARLARAGHEALAASPSTGVDTIIGAGLDAAFAGASVVVDVTNTANYADEPVMTFFRTSTANVLAAARKAGVGHVVALTIVGADRAPDSGYLRAKIAQERAIEAGGVGYTILRATQFFEFLAPIANASANDGTIRVTSAPLQPVAGDDVADALSDVALAAPVNGIREIAGPEAIPLDRLLRTLLAKTGDARPVVGDPAIGYFGAKLDAHTLVASPGARIGKVSFEAWLAAQ